MADVNLLSHQDMSDHRDQVPLQKDGHVAVQDRDQWQVVHFQALAHVPNALPDSLVHACDEDNLVSSLN